MKVNYISGLRKLKHNLYTTAVIKGDFKKDDVVNIPMKHHYIKDEFPTYFEIQGITVAYENSYIKFDILNDKKIWRHIGTRQSFKDYEDGEHLYFVYIPKGTWYYEIGNDKMLFNNVIIRAKAE